jgi:hypothetical protein
MPKKEKKGSAVEELVKQLEEALERKMKSERSIQRGGDNIIVPEFMSLEDAVEAIQEFERSMEEPTEQILSFRGHKYEVLGAMDRGLRRSFGSFFGSSMSVQTFFGAMQVSARSTTIPISATDKLTVPTGNVRIPGLPIKLQIAVKENKKDPLSTELMIKVEYRQKYDPLVQKIREAIDYELANESVFKGKAITSNFEFIDLTAFDTNKIVYSKKTQLELETHIFGPIKNVKKLEGAGMQIRRSILLYGAFGTGKTLTALVASKICTENGWTFLNVLPGENIKTAIQFAQKYQPALVFFEDIDQATPHGRTGDVNEILNVVDGFLSKRSQVMTILTTNHTDKIEKAMLRPGRIDAVIQMGDVDELVMEKMIESYCPEMTDHETLEMPKLLEAAENYTPSFIAEACHRSALYAINRAGGNGNKPRVSSEDIQNSLIGLRSQFELMMSGTGVERSDRIEESIFKIVDKRVAQVSGETTNEVRDMMYDEGIIRD